MTIKEAIKNILRKWGCCHEWEEVKIIEIYRGYELIDYQYLYICRKCGKMKWVKT